MKIKKKHTILRDTSEQRPLEFHGFNIRARACNLDYGDYRMRFLDGEVSSTVFERKSVPDLFGSLTKGHDRFMREIKRAHEDSATLVIIVEGNLGKVAKGTRHSKVQGISIIRTLFSLWVRYGVVPVFAKDRREASEFIIQYYMAEWRKKTEEQHGK